jgi:hypothetical protein
LIQAGPDKPEMNQPETKLFEAIGLTILGMFFVLIVIHSWHAYVIHPHYWDKPYVAEARRLGFELVHREEGRILGYSYTRSLIFAHPNSIKKVTPFLAAQLMWFSPTYSGGAEVKRAVVLFDCESKLFKPLRGNDESLEDGDVRQDYDAKKRRWNAMNDQMIKYFCTFSSRAVKPSAKRRNTRREQLKTTGLSSLARPEGFEPPTLRSVV